MTSSTRRWIIGYSLALLVYGTWFAYGIVKQCYGSIIRDNVDQWKQGWRDMSKTSERYEIKHVIILKTPFQEVSKEGNDFIGWETEVIRFSPDMRKLLQRSNK